MGTSITLTTDSSNMGHVYVTGSGLGLETEGTPWVGNYSGQEHIFIRFPTSSIPANQQITSASLLFTKYDKDGLLTKIKVRGVKQLLPVVPTTLSEFLALPLTDSSTTFDLDNTVSSFDLSIPLVIQEVVSQSGWSSSNPIMIVLLDNGSSADNDMSFFSTTTSLPIIYTPNLVTGTVAITSSSSVVMSGKKGAMGTTNSSSASSITVSGKKSASSTVLIVNSAIVTLVSGVPIYNVNGTVTITGASNITPDGNKQGILPSVGVSSVVGINISAQKDVMGSISISNTSVSICLGVGVLTRVFVSLKGELDAVIELDGYGVIDINVYGEIITTVDLRGDGIMTKRNQNFTMYNGETKELKFTINLPIGSTLNDATAQWEMYPVTTITKLSVDDGITIVDNVCTVHLLPDDTLNCGSGTFLHQMQITDDLGRVSVVETGKCTMLANLIN